MDRLTVSKVAERAAVSADTIRYYERTGLLPPPARTDSGYRVYESGVADRLRFIKGAQRLGLRLREIRELLEIRDRGLCPCGHTEALLRQRIAEIDAETERLRGLRSELASVVERFPSDACPEPGRWPCEAEFIAKGGGDA